MKTDANGGASAGDDLEKRLSGQFAADLDRAEQDYPALRGKLVGSVPAARARRGLWPRIALPMTSAAVLAVAVLVGAGLLSGSATSPGVGSVPSLDSGPASSRVVMGADGVPSQIDGQRVYRVTDQAQWQNLGGSFLLAGYAVDAPIPCAPPPSTQPQSSPENALVPQCGTVELGAKSTGQQRVLLQPGAQRA